MPPTRRQLRALGSLQLVGYANNPSKVITELAFIADKYVNAKQIEGVQSDVDVPLEVQFDEFMDGVNSRGKGTKTRQRKMTVEQAAAVLLVAVQQGHVELITKPNDPHTIDAIKILPRAKRILATFLPKLRGYGDIPYDHQYRGAIALAKRHFFPKGRAPTKKELMALLLQSYQEQRELRSQCQPRPRPTLSLGVQTSMGSVSGLLHTETANKESAPNVHPLAYASTVRTPSSSDFESKVNLPSNDVAVDVPRASVALGPDVDPFGCDDDNYGTDANQQPVAATPVGPRSFNPYMTPVSNPRHLDQTTATPSLFDASPTPVTSGDIQVIPNDDDMTVESLGAMLQATAMSQGKLGYYYNKFVAACEQQIGSLTGRKEEIQRNFDSIKRELDQTEQRLREANVDRSRLRRRVDKLVRGLNSVCGQLLGLTGEGDSNGEELSE